jgi:hypothetical protein
LSQTQLGGCCADCRPLNWGRHFLFYDSEGLVNDKELLSLLGNGTRLQQSILDDIKEDIDFMFKDCFYYLRIIGEIVLSAQQFEGCLRTYLDMNGINESNIWRTGKLLTELGNRGLFNEREVEILRKIVEYRNWVAHEIYKQEEQRLFLNDYRNCKLAATKHLLLEAIDFVNDKIEKQKGKSGVANIINNSYDD